MTPLAKRLLYPLGLVASLVLVVGVARVIAAPPGSVYTPGETLAPTCAPGDTNCTVTAPMVAVTPGTSGNVLTSNGSAWTSAAVSVPTFQTAVVRSGVLVNASAGLSIETVIPGIYLVSGVTGTPNVVASPEWYAGNTASRVEARFLDGQLSFKTFDEFGVVAARDFTFIAVNP